MMTMDPTTLWFYRGLLGAFTLLCLVGIVLLLSRLTTGRISVLTSLYNLVAENKTYKLMAGWVIYTLVQHFAYGQPIDWNALLTASGITTARMAIGRTEAATAEALEAALAATPPAKEPVVAATLTPTPPPWPTPAGSPEPPVKRA